MKGMLVVRAAGLLLVASQFSNCAWLFKPKSETAVTAPTPAPKPKPGPENLPKPQPDPDPKPNPEPSPQPPAPTPPSKQNVPTARAVPGRPGFVFSPFNNKLLDVEGIPSGRLMADPHYPIEEKKYFRVP
jgi:hypothetical protein